MDDLEFLRGRVPGYADYADEDARHEVDKQMRAYLGETLALARDRLTPDGPLGDRLEGLLLRCEFSDQRVIRATDHARIAGALADRIHQLDRELVEIADRIRAASTPEELAEELDVAARVLDERFGALSDAPHR
ncbi:MAG TPA: hypothetical protein VGN14_16990 [Candidatus Elarobacter sp.]|jgi:hypothetical protein